MTHNWKPGDIALVEAGCWANRVVALRSGVPSNMGWAYCGEQHEKSSYKWSSDASGIVTPIRPLLVIDPEDRAQIMRLADVFCQAPSRGWVDQMQAALRSLLELQPSQRMESPDLPGRFSERIAHLRELESAATRGPWERPGCAAEAVRELEEARGK